MNEMGFLLDEHIPIIIQERLKQMEPKVHVYAIGDGIAPPKRHHAPSNLTSQRYGWRYQDLIFLCRQQRRWCLISQSDGYNRVGQV
jgi:hypothetical protein